MCAYIWVNFRHIEFDIWRFLEYGFCHINKLEFFVSLRSTIIINIKILFFCSAWMFSFLKHHFYDKNNIKLFERKTTIKGNPWQNTFHEKTILSKRIRKIQELFPFGKFVTELLVFTATNTFFSWIWYLSLTVAQVFVLYSIFKNAS